MSYRVLVILIFTCFCQIGFSQEIPKRLKYDRILYSGDSSFVAVFKGKKAGIYNLREKRFELKMIKQEIVHSPFFDIFTVFTKTSCISFSAANTEILMPLENGVGTVNVSASKYEVKQIDQDEVVLTDVEFEFTGNEHKEMFSFDFDNPFAGSGVYNLKSRNWEVLQKIS